MVPTFAQHIKLGAVQYLLNMTEQLFVQQLSQMPHGMKAELLAYFEYLVFKCQLRSPTAAPRPSSKKAVRKRSPRQRTAPQAGFLKGAFVMADDFNAPLDDFKEYVP